MVRIATGEVVMNLTDGEAPVSCLVKEEIECISRHLVADFHGCTEDLNDPKLVMDAGKGVRGCWGDNHVVPTSLQS